MTRLKKGDEVKERCFWKDFGEIVIKKKKQGDYISVLPISKHDF